MRHHRQRVSIKVSSAAHARLTATLGWALPLFLVFFASSCGTEGEESELPATFDEVSIPDSQMWRTVRPVNLEVAVAPELLGERGLNVVEVRDPISEALMYRGGLPATGQVAIALPIGIHLRQLEVVVVLSGTAHRAHVDIASRAKAIVTGSQ